MRLHLTAAALLTAAACFLLYTALAFCSTNASAFTLGVGDGAQYPAAPSAQLGAKTYRVVIDPALPLESYTPRIVAHRQVGQEPQLVIGGTGTINHASSKGLVAAAVAAAKRWPSAYSIGVVNEPNESGMGVCEYDRTFIAAYRALKPMGVKRVLFGEWSPNETLVWHSAALNPHRCHGSAQRLRRMVKHIAWHGYGTAINLGPALRLIHRQFRAVAPTLHVTEAGYTITFRAHTASANEADLGGLRYWHKALRAVKRDRINQIVAWDVHSPQSGAWDSGLIDSHGRRRPAFDLIAAAVTAR